MMGISNPGGLSLGEFTAIKREWNRRHAETKVQPPTEAEFDRAVMNVRGVLH